MGISLLIYAAIASFSGFFLAKRAFPMQPKINGLLSFFCIFFPPLLLGLGVAALLIKPVAPQATVEDFHKIDKITLKNIVDNIENNANLTNVKVCDMKPQKANNFSRRNLHKLMDSGADALYFIANQVELARDPQDIFLLEREANRVMLGLSFGMRFNVIPTEMVDNILSPNIRTAFMPSVIEKDDHNVYTKISIMNWYASKNPLTKSQALDYLKETVGLNISNAAYELKNNYKQQELERKKHLFSV